MVNLMDRNELIKETCKKNFTCEILIIGGGATGLGVAVDAASRGYSVILLEQSDFAKGTQAVAPNWYMGEFDTCNKEIYKWWLGLCTKEEE